MLLDAHRLATRLVERDRDDPDAYAALDAVRRLLWAVAEVEHATRDAADYDPGLNLVADLEPNDVAVLQEVDEAARALQVNLAARDEQTAKREIETADFSSVLRQRHATRQELRARTRRVRKLEDAEAAAELARLAGQDLARAMLEDEQPPPTEDELRRAGVAHRPSHDRSPDVDVDEAAQDRRE